MAGAISMNGRPASDPESGHGAGPAHTRSSVRPGWIAALSLATGSTAAFAFAFLPFVPVEESAITGAVLCGFGVGWLMLWLLSARFTEHPQRWAAVPALLMGASGLLLMALGSPRAVGWLWPPALLTLVTWMIYRTHRDMPSRAGRAQLYLVFAILAIAAIGGGYQAVGEATDSNPMPATGELIDVGGHSLYLSCTGSGSPTVVLEPGAGATSAQMGWIAPAVARSTRVCLYDRAGRGWSEPADSPQDGARIATDLRTLLHRAGEPGPYVLAGHSFGGLYVRIFAEHYPDEVSGLVLVDSTASSEPAKSVIPTPRIRHGESSTGRVPVLASVAARVGLTRVMGQLDLGSLPPRSRDEARTSIAQAKWVTSAIDEYMRGTASMQEAASLHDFADKPLFVLTAGEHPASWMAEQNDLLTLSSNSAHQIIEGATHTDVVLEEEYAAATSRAVLAVVESARNHRPLTQ